MDPVPPLAPAAPAPSSTPGVPRWMRVLLVVSLALNLLVLGVLLGGALTHGPGRGPRPAEMTLGPLASALDPEDRRVILSGLVGHPDLRPLAHEERESDLARLREALRGDPFDPDAARAALAARGERVARAQAAVQEALLARLDAMDAAERRALADRIEADGRR